MLLLVAREAAGSPADSSHTGWRIPRAGGRSLTRRPKLLLNLAAGRPADVQGGHEQQQARGHPALLLQHHTRPAVCTAATGGEPQVWYCMLPQHGCKRADGQVPCQLVEACLQSMLQ